MWTGNFNHGRTFRRVAWSAVLLAGMAISACQSPGMQKVATQHALTFETTDQPLPLRLLHRQPAAETAFLRLYLSGDGTPWRAGRPANNPTGSRLPLGLRLFLRDPDAHGYIGRPCYHFPDTLPAGCTPRLWTSHRYSEEVVAALSEQVYRLAQHYDREAIELVGHSGGGTLALLLAERMPEVNRVVTIAAPLDPHAWTALHGLLPLDGSLSPLAVEGSGGAEELHFMGEKDEVVPPALASEYRQRHPEASLQIVEDFDHLCCWESYWPGLLGN